MTPANSERPAVFRIDSRAAVSNARSMVRKVRRQTYDEMLENAPFQIRSWREVLDTNGKARDEPDEPGGSRVS